MYTTPIIDQPTDFRMAVPVITEARIEWTDAPVRAMLAWHPVPEAIRYEIWGRPVGAREVQTWYTLLYADVPSTVDPVTGWVTKIEEPVIHFRVGGMYVVAAIGAQARSWFSLPMRMRKHQI